jgi:hypothetical protein
MRKDGETGRLSLRVVSDTYNEEDNPGGFEVYKHGNLDAFKSNYPLVDPKGFKVVTDTPEASKVLRQARRKRYLSRAFCFAFLVVAVAEIWSGFCYDGYKHLQLLQAHNLTFPVQEDVKYQILATCDLSTNFITRGRSVATDFANQWQLAQKHDKCNPASSDVLNTCIDLPRNSTRPKTCIPQLCMFHYLNELFWYLPCGVLFILFLIDKACGLFELAGYGIDDTDSDSGDFETNTLPSLRSCLDDPRQLMPCDSPASYMPCDGPAFYVAEVLDDSKPELIPVHSPLLRESKKREARSYKSFPMSV